MALPRVVALSVLVCATGWADQASAGWVIDQAVKGAGADTRQTVLVQANTIKTLIYGEDGKPIMAAILNLDTQMITQVDYRERRFFTATIQEFSEMMRGVQESVAQHMAEAMKQVQEALKDVPLEQRKMAEEMMRSRMPHVAPRPEGCRESKVELRKTGQQAAIAGYTAIRYDVLHDGELDSEIWVTREITAWREVDLEKLKRFSTEMTALAPRCTSGGKGLRMPGQDSSWKLAGEGYPVRTVHKRDGEREVVVEVVKAEQRTISTAEFQTPAGFARKMFQELMGR